MAKIMCQRMACNAIFSEDDNPDGSCRYHDGPIFHDGMKEWSCCKKRSHDFNMFLEIPGCKSGKHTTEKPITTPAPKPVRAAPSAVQNKESSANCSRCRQGFFCSDHNSQPRPLKPMVTTVPESDPAENSQAAVKKVADLNEPQTCRNKGCGKTFKEKDNHETACEYHPGPPVFHDRVRGWKCCEVYVKEFDEFMVIPPCTKGWHGADAA